MSNAAQAPARTAHAASDAALICSGTLPASLRRWTAPRHALHSSTAARARGSGGAPALRACCQFAQHPAVARGGRDGSGSAPAPARGAAA
jgi:hypothetical protein